MPNKITLPKWVLQEVAVKDLIPFERNPRKNTQDDYNRLRVSILKFGVFNPIKATQDLRILGGHLRKRVLTDLGVSTVAVMTPEDHLSDDDFYEIVVRDNVSNGIWDADKLSADRDMQELVEWGLTDWTNPKATPKQAETKQPEAAPQQPKLPFLIASSESGDEIKMLAERLKDEGFNCTVHGTE